MTVAEIREKLKEFPDDMLACLADWSEGYMFPRVEPVGRMKIVTGTYIHDDEGDDDKEHHEGEFLQIG